MFNLKKAFTLAEVLITLAIIGVIAALVVPVLTVSYQKKQVITGLKKAYSTLSDAYTQAQGQYGPADTWNWGNNDISGPRAEIPINYILSNLKVEKICRYNMDSCHYEISYLNGNLSYAQTIYYLADGSAFLGCSPTRLTASHDVIAMYCIFDINGPGKPNIIGKDIHYFEVFGDYRRYSGTVLPYGFDKSDDELKDVCTKASGGNKGFYCAAKIIRDGWEIKYDW